MNSSYFNTTGAQGALLKAHERQAKSQEELILEYFKTRPGMEYSPSQVRKYLNLTGAPLTSIRRAMSNLTEQRTLRKTDRQVKGPYGRREHTWTLNRRLTIQEELCLD